MLSKCARRSNQSILKEINPEFSLEALMLKLKLQYFSHLMWAANSLEKTPRQGKVEGKRRRGKQRMRWLDGIIDSMDMSFSKFWDTVKDREAWHAVVHGITKSWTRWSNWATRRYCTLNKPVKSYTMGLCFSSILICLNMKFPQLTGHSGLTGSQSLTLAVDLFLLCCFANQSTPPSLKFLYFLQLVCSVILLNCPRHFG